MMHSRTGLASTRKTSTASDTTAGAGKPLRVAATCDALTSVGNLWLDPGTIVDNFIK